MILQDQPSQPEHLSSAVTAREQRDAQRAMDHWRRNTWASGGVPLLDTFDFSPMKGDWGYRFLICGDGTSENAVFATYGSKLAQLLGLPDKPVTTSPFIDKIPEIYRPVFLEGYSRAISEGAPVNLKGTFSAGSAFELYRAIFMPIMLQPHWSKQLVFGTFNCKIAGAR